MERKRFFVLAAAALLSLIATGQAFSAGSGGSRDRMLAALLAQVPGALSRAPTEPSKVSVYGIECANKAFDTVAFGDQLTSAILDSGRYKVIDRKSLDVLLQEQELQLSGVVDDTGEMIQAGKIIGVQGFFFGSLEFGKEAAVLTLKLVDVESGAIVLSKKLSASDPAFVQLGGGVSYTFVPLDLGNNGSVDQTNHGVGFGVSYRQGFDAWTWGFAGADVFFWRGFSPQAPQYTISCAALTPKLYFMLPRPLGFTLSPYVGATVEMLLLGGNPTQPDSLGFWPTVGVDINPVKPLCVFLEGGWRFVPVNVRNGSGAWIPAGPVFMAGVKLYFSM
jgi:curli biogenesis system outer membrane secretion channel CsgG